MERVLDSDTSSGQFIWVAEGRGNLSDSYLYTGYGEYNFEVAVSGNYAIWGRVNAADGNNDSFFVSIDGADYALWDMPKSNTWFWDQVSNRGGDDPVI